MAEQDRSRLLGLLVAHYEELSRYLVRRFGLSGGVAGTAGDAMHDVYLRLQGLQSVPHIENPRAYLFRVASNIALDRLRASRRDERRFVAEEAALDEPTSMPDAEMAMERRDRMYLLARAIAELSPRRREVLLLHRFDGLTHAQIAVRLGISRSAVEKHVMKALAHCRDRLLI